MPFVELSSCILPTLVSVSAVYQRGRAIDSGEVEIGKQIEQIIPPGLFWRFQVTIHHPMYLKFNVSFSKDSLLGIYGRRNIPPTHTQVLNRLSSATDVTIEAADI